MALTETPLAQAWREFGLDACPVCDGFKKKKQSFCGPCYVHLPLDMQHALWKRFGNGYEEAYHAAREWLLEERKANKG